MPHLAKSSSSSQKPKGAPKYIVRCKLKGQTGDDIEMVSNQLSFAEAEAERVEMVLHGFDAELEEVAKKPKKKAVQWKKLQPALPGVPLRAEEMHGAN